MSAGGFRLCLQCSGPIRDDEGDPLVPFLCPRCERERDAILNRFFPYRARLRGLTGRTDTHG